MMIEDLKGPALDWAVALLRDKERPGLAQQILLMKGKCSYSPSSDPFIGFNIIKENRIGLLPWAREDWTGWRAEKDNVFYDVDPLVAGLRVFIWSKTGQDTIAVPIELLELSN